MKTLKVLVACEFSGIVRDAFIAKGHDAVSCDLLPSDRPGPHIQADVADVLEGMEFDMLIAFPPCTYLCSSGLHWNLRRPERAMESQLAAEFFMKLANADVEKIAIENPIGCMSTFWRKPDQIIQPYEFGHPESKKTCLWLKNLPLLKPTNILPKPACGYWDNQTPSGQNKLGPSQNRAKIRSTTYAGIALAMSEQWG
jgi:hypothetical protein